MARLSAGRAATAGGAALAAAGIALGAFGAHALRDSLGADALGWWHTAVQYQMWNAIGLLALGAAAGRRSGAPAALIGAGTILFSGSLYLMALSGLRWPGAVTPLGGTLMIAGWALAAWRLARTG